MKAGVIPGGRCAELRYPGNTNNLEPAATYLYRDWLPASGYTCDTRPCMEYYPRNWRMEADGSFACELRMPVSGGR